MKKESSDFQRSYQKRFYELHPRIQDLSGRLKKAEKIQVILKEHLNYPLEQAAVLDIGCSSGVLTCALAHLFRHTMGIEFDEIALHNRPAENCAAEFMQGDTMFLPIANESIDIIICTQVYEHVPDDVRLANEMFRVLKVGGVVFFSGPNKLFPIEPHYNLPFLHWLPEKLADLYLRLFRAGDHYYERSRTIWELRKLFMDFKVTDLTLKVLYRDLHESKNPLKKILKNMPEWIWRSLIAFIPNYNWFLKKQKSVPHERKSCIT